MASVLIGNSCELWSLGMATLLRQEGHEVAGLCSEIETFVELAAKRRPRLLLVARGLLSPPDLQRIRSGRPGGAAGSIVLVVDEREAFGLDEFLNERCDALLLSESPLGVVLDCLRTVLAGRQWIDPEVRRLLRQPSQPATAYASLSLREEEVAGLAMAGLSNKAIARRLGVSDGTIKIHMHHILSKMGLTNRSQMLAQPDSWGARRGALAQSGADYTRFGQGHPDPASRGRTALLEGQSNVTELKLVREAGGTA